MTITARVSITFIYALLFWSCQPSEKNVKNDTSSSTISPITTYTQWFEEPAPLVSAHRGGPYPGFPENAIETFQNIIDQTPTIIECDISMTKDSVLVMMHDNTLDRTTTGTGNVSEIRYDEIKDLFLVDNEGDTTSFRVPTLDAVLAWGKDKVLFTLDVKRGVPFEKVVDAVENFDAASYAAIITYRIQDAKLVHSLNSNIIISVSAGDDGALEQLRQSEIPVKNLLGFVGTREPEIAHYEKLKSLGIKCILGTLGNLDKKAVASKDDGIYLSYINNGANIIATDRPLEVAMMIYSQHK